MAEVPKIQCGYCEANLLPYYSDAYMEIECPACRVSWMTTYGDNDRWCEYGPFGGKPVNITAIPNDFSLSQ